MPLTVINGPFIQPGESLSDAVDCSGGNAVRITMPGYWTPANLSFQISTDGEFYNDLFDAEGNEVVIPVVTGSAVPLDRSWAGFWNFIKFRSGTRDNPVPQTPDVREFAITLDIPIGGEAAAAAAKRKR